MMNRFRVGANLGSPSISASARSHMWQKCWEMVAEVRQQRGVLDLKSYNLVIDACAKRGQWKRAQAILEWMSRDRCKSDMVSFASAINACERCSSWQSALTVFSLAITRLQSVDHGLLVALASAANACIKSQQWIIALSLLSNERWRFASANDPVCSSVALSAAAKSGDWRYCVWCLSEALTAGQKPTASGLVAVVSVCREQGKWEQAAQVLGILFAQTSAVGLGTVALSEVADACELASDARVLHRVAFELPNLAPGIANPSLNGLDNAFAAAALFHRFGIPNSWSDRACMRVLFSGAVQELLQLVPPLRAGEKRRSRLSALSVSCPSGFGDAARARSVIDIVSTCSGTGAVGKFFFNQTKDVRDAILASSSNSCASAWRESSDQDESSCLLERICAGDAPGKVTTQHIFAFLGYRLIGRGWIIMSGCELVQSADRTTDPVKAQ